MGNRTVTQKREVREWLLQGNPITPIEALNYFGVFRLSAIIYDLRKEGLPIKTSMVYGENRTRYAKYLLTL